MWEVASNELSPPSLALFVLVRMPNYFLTIKRLRVEQTQRRQSSTVKRGGTKLRRAINLTRLCAASNGKKMTMKITKIIIIFKKKQQPRRLPKFSKAPFRYPLFYLHRG